MGLWDKPLPEPTKEPARAAPNQPVDTETHILGSLWESTKDVGRAVAYGLNEGWWNFVGNVTEAVKTAGKEPLPVSASRLLLGSELADGISPYKRMLQEVEGRAALEGKLFEARKAINANERFALSKADIVQEMVPQLSPDGIATEMIYSGAKAVGDPTNLMGGPVAAGAKTVAAKSVRPAAAAFFSGAAAEGGKNVGGGAASMVFGEDARAVGENVGTVVGAVAGGNVQDLRGQAIKEVAKKGYDVSKAAAQTARDVVRAKDIKQARSIFNDNYGDLSAKSQNIVKDYVRAQYAVELSKDTQVAKAWDEFDDAVKRTGGPDLSEQWTVAQRSNNPILIAEERYRVPLTGAEAVEGEVRRRTVEKGVVKRFNSLFKGAKVADSKELTEGLDDLARETNLKLDVLATEQQQAINNVTHWDMPGVPKTSDKGAELRALADAEVEQTRAIARGKYDANLSLADELGVEIQPGKLRDSLTGVKDTILAQLKSGTVPESVKKLGGIISPETSEAGARVKQLQDTLLTATDPAVKLKINREILDARKSMKELSDKNLTLRDVNDIAVALNKDIQRVAASGTPEAAMAAENLRKIKTAVEDSIAGGVPDVVRGGYEDARRYYREVQAPRSREGANALVQRKAGTGRPGEERVVDEEMFKIYLDPNKLETRMREFDNLFSGKLRGGEPNKRAYELLGEAIENQYHKDLLARGDIKPEAHEAFLRKWNSALERVPGVREKLEDSFNMASAFERDKQIIHEKWKDISNHPLTKTFGPDDAKKVLEKALSDPNQMGRLVNYTLETQGRAGLKPLAKYIFDNANPIAQGEYKPGTIRAMLRLGKADNDRVGAMQVLFRNLYGKEKGDKLYGDLDAIATLQERFDATKPERLVAQSSGKGPLEQQLGSSASSVYATLNNAAAGRTSPVWSTLFLSGRFSNARFGTAWRKLQTEALYEPDAAEAIKQMMITNANSPFPVTSALALANRMGSEGKGFLQRLFDIGAIGPVTYQGIRIGAKESTKEDDK